MDQRELIDKLLTTPDQNSPWFPIELNRTIFTSSTDRKLLNEIVQDEGVENEIRFKAFYGYLNIARRQRDIGVYDDYLRKHQSLFSTSEFPMIHLLVSQANLNHLQAGEFTDQRRNTALREAQKCMNILPDHFGVVAHYATVVSTCEAHVEYEQRDFDLINECIELQADGIQRSNDQNPKYHATRAKLFMLVRRWPESLTEIAKAIDLEDSTLSDYAIRVGEYQLLRLEIQSEQRMQKSFESALSQIETVRDESVDLKRSLQDVQANTLTLVGLLAAIVAFITTSTGIASNLSFTDAVRLLIGSSGSMLVVFSGIFWLVNSQSGGKHWWKYSVVAVVGLTLCGFTLLLR